MRSRATNLFREGADPGGYSLTKSHQTRQFRPPVTELQGVGAFGSDEPLGLALEFDDDDVLVGELSYDGPVKSLVDDLTPVFGERLISGRSIAKDYRVRELRITRGHPPGQAAVTVTVRRL